MRTTARLIWLCACLRYWPDRGLVFECLTYCGFGCHACSQSLKSSSCWAGPFTQALSVLYQVSCLKLRFVFSTRVIEAKLHWVDFSLLGRHFLDRHAIFLPHERLLKPKEQSLPFVCLRRHKGCRICPRDRLEITSR